jgi:hypothetical protein
MASIEATASTKRKTKESIRVESLLPEYLRDSSENLIKLLEDYYIFMNKGYNPSYEINTIAEERDIDTADHYIGNIQRQIAATVPRNLVTDKVKLYKNLVKYYNERGTTESIQTFFKILLEDNVEVHYPKQDMLIPSDGKWSAADNRYLNNDGFLSDKKKLQDSYFYQKFSYVIRTGNNVDVWRDAFNKLVHPSGFIFFGEIFLLLLALDQQSKMPSIQPGLISDEDIPLLIQLFSSTVPVSVVESLLKVILQPVYDGVRLRKRKEYTVFLKFFDETPIQSFQNYTIEEGINSLIDRTNVGTSIE